MTDTLSYRGLAWIAAMALFMQSLDATILNTALPSIAADLHESALEMQMAIISYSLTVALFIPLTAWLANKFGTLTVFRNAVFLFVLGSVACALSASLETLILSRILQGLGGALMMPVARLAIIQSVPKYQLLQAWNLMATAGLIGPILGPILGGWLVTHASWHWIFLINLPIGGIGILFAGKVMRNTKGNVQKLDWEGFLLFSLGLVGLTLGLDLLSESQSHSWLTSGSLILGISLLGAYYRYAKHHNDAILPLSLFRHRTFRLGILSNLFIRLSGSGIPFLLPLMFQLVFGYSAELSGWMLAPIALTSVLCKTIVGKILERLGYKTTLILTALCMALSIITMSFLSVETSLWAVIFNLMCYGACMSIIYTAVNTLTIADLTQSEAGAGSTMLSIVQQVGIGIGIAVSSIILSCYRQFLAEESNNNLPQAFSWTFLTSTIFAIFLVWTLSYLRKRDGSQLRKKIH
ncbi:MDR family MFS transporter [Rodentibacter caecimuris]|uniref:MFS transporter n=1 Tax=Rodentibacter caecimuris TaxID=1796644 RepID=A0ABX3KXA1_9PAST|nr:MFS transporter [Rodentibacter heylii]